MTHTLPDLVAPHKIIPVVTVESPEAALPIAEALAEGGLPVIEITLRTSAGLKAIALLRKKLPKLVIGAGTVTDAASFKQAAASGADFLVSPGLTPALTTTAKKNDIPFLPGVSTLTEAMLAREAGFRSLKFFPAELSGGLPMLNNFAALLPELSFCPTGGVNARNLRQYLAQPNVFCVGGSFIVPKDVLSAQDWRQLTRLTRETLSRCAA